MSIHVKSLALLALALPVFAGCASQRSYYENLWDQEEIALHNHDDIYQIHFEERIYLFDDQATYADFLKNHETPFRLTQIGAGPKGETVVYGLRGKDKEKLSGKGVSSVAFTQGELKPFKRFYGELNTADQVIATNNIDTLKQLTTGTFQGTLIDSALKGERNQAVKIAAQSSEDAAQIEANFQRIRTSK